MEQDTVYDIKKTIILMKWMAQESHGNIKDLLWNEDDRQKLQKMFSHLEHVFKIH